jgi:phosphoribosyl-ATP pyrophosphohydrolase
VVVKGWREKTGRRATDVLKELAPLVGGFLVTFVEREGRLQGIDMDRVREVIDAAGSVRVTVAGGVSSLQEIAEIDRLGADAQVGMALYTGTFELAEAFAAPLTSDRADGLWPTVVVDERGVALGLAYSDLESLRAALKTHRGIYRSRTRGLWIKGESSGATQELLRVDLDCDRDTLRFTVRQYGAGFCHRKTWTCWGAEHGLHALERTLASRRAHAPPGSYTRRLLDDPGLLASKLAEEARELVGATTPDQVAHEAADVMYFALVAMARAGITLADVDAALDRRAMKVTRRPGDAKPDSTEPTP